MTDTLVVRRVAGALGAEISGVDLSRDLEPDTVAALRQALLDHLVIFLRDQPIEPARFLAFARAFGTPVEYPFVKGLDAFPQIIEVAKLEGETTNFGGIWHSDTVYLDEPPMGSMLLAREIPPQGGDTLFANQYLAYEALSPTFRDLLDEDLPATLRLYRKPPPEPHHELILEEDYDTLEWRGSWVDDMDNWDDRTFICETELLDLLGMEIEDFEEPQTFYMTVEQ